MNFDSNRADRLTAVVLCLLGLGMAWGGFDMDRLEVRRIHPASIPGLVPMILGVCMMICAVFLGIGARSAPDVDVSDEETMNRDAAILVLICMYVGAIYGGSRSAILLNIPGTPASAATSLDGYPLAQRGQAGYAMGLATAGSAMGTIVDILLLVMLAPALANIALDFGSFEFFWLAVFGIVISGQLTGGVSPLKVILRVCLD